MDGRDTPPKSGIQYINEIENFLQPFPNAKIGTVIGRFYAMDRDKRWERVEIAYKALTQKDSNSFSSAKMAIDDAYSKNETDEFVLPRQVTGTPRVSSDDQIVFFNFRADRAREISVAFGDPEFKSFEAKVKVKADNYITFSEYQEDFKFPVIFKRERPKNVLGELYASKGLRQLRVAETEKYAHVTYFFNGGEEEVFKNEERVMVPSPKDVKTYDQKPEMSVFEVTDEILKGMDQGFDLIVANFANGDMVGHTGNEEAAIKAVEAMDKCLGKILEKSENKKYEFIITADHGNCEQMIDPESGVSFTQHTTNLVPLVWVGEKTKPLRNGGLADIAPTILDIVGWQQPAEMTGNSLIVK
jgi:2,3-bisphosphoglycerate-independent phosphoglycerate mutase